MCCWRLVNAAVVSITVTALVFNVPCLWLWWAWNAGRAPCSGCHCIFICRAGLSIGSRWDESRVEHSCKGSSFHRKGLGMRPWGLGVCFVSAGVTVLCAGVMCCVHVAAPSCVATSSYKHWLLWFVVVFMQACGFPVLCCAHSSKGPCRICLFFVQSP